MSNLHPKTSAAGIGGAIVILVVWVLNLVGLNVPPEVAAALATLSSFGASFAIRQ